jgi:catechol 2,3-dioxygenase-like lactoylglutathione lyase family enzyme
MVTAVWAQDVPAAAHFYRDVLGLQPVHHHDARPSFELEGSYLVILQGRPRPAEDAHPERFPLFALTVDDLDQAVEHLQAHGVSLPWGVEGHQNRYVMFHDPGGNLIELVQEH